MTLTTALILNGALVAALVAALVHVMRIPFRRRFRSSTPAASMRTADAHELSRAA